MNPEMTYLQHLESIERIAAFVARRGHLNPDETGEFVQIVRVRLFEDDYGVIRKFEGRSSFSTYLTTVILRLFHQWRVEMWGKWRPSAEAKRLGDKAITLERLLTRDGFTFAEAVKVLTTRSGDEFTVPELEAIYVRLPLRTPRPMLVSDEVSAELAATDGDADDRVELRDRERAARCCAAALDAALARFDAEDRLILQLRFWDGLQGAGHRADRGDRSEEDLQEAGKAVRRAASGARGGGRQASRCGQDAGERRSGNPPGPALLQGRKHSWSLQ